MDAQEFQVLVLQQLQELKRDIHDVREEVRDTRMELKNDIARLDQKIDATRAELKGDIAELRSDMKEDRQKLEDVYQARNSVKIKFGWQWGMVSFVLAIFAAGVTQVFD